MDANLSEPNISVISLLEKCKKTTGAGIDYWMARDLMSILGYARWENFTNAIEKAMMACSSAGIGVHDQFRETTKGITGGKGAEVQRADFYLTRYACYLICMNGDTGKREIGVAQTYFAVQTHRQEIRDQIDASEDRLIVRERIKTANKKLGGAAKRAGVVKFGIFHDAGYKGLYGGLGKAEIERLKRIPEKEDLLDCIDRAELAANEFRITQAEDKLIREDIRGETPAINAHFQVGRKVRETIRELGGKMPETLPPVPSIKRLSARKRSAEKKLRASSKTTLWYASV
jgi:DNA-damage-inducible protein D